MVDREGTNTSSEEIVYGPLIAVNSTMVTGTYRTYHTIIPDVRLFGHSDYAKALPSIPELPLFSITADLQK